MGFLSWLKGVLSALRFKIAPPVLMGFPDFDANATRNEEYKRTNEKFNEWREQNCIEATRDWAPISEQQEEGNQLEVSVKLEKAYVALDWMLKNELNTLGKQMEPIDVSRVKVENESKFNLNAINQTMNNEIIPTKLTTKERFPFNYNDFYENIEKTDHQNRLRNAIMIEEPGKAFKGSKTVRTSTLKKKKRHLRLTAGGALQTPRISSCNLEEQLNISLIAGTEVADELKNTNMFFIEKVYNNPNFTSCDISMDDSFKQKKVNVSLEIIHNNGEIFSNSLTKDELCQKIQQIHLGMCESGETGSNPAKTEIKTKMTPRTMRVKNIRGRSSTNLYNLNNTEWISVHEAIEKYESILKSMIESSDAFNKSERSDSKYGNWDHVSREPKRPRGSSCSTLLRLNQDDMYIDDDFENSFLPPNLQMTGYVNDFDED